MEFSNLSRDALAPIYLIVSADPLLVDRAVSAVRQCALDPATSAFNCDIVDGKGATAAQVLGAAQTLPMMAQRRFVLVRDIPSMAAAELAQLIPYLSAPSATTAMVATASKIDKRLKFFQVASKLKLVHELTPPRNLAPWIRAEADRLGVRIAAPAAARLGDVVGKDLARLSLGLEQLALYAGDRAIAVDDVDDLIAETRERTVFELTDAIGEGDRAKAFVALSALFEQRQSAIGMVMMLARHVRQLAIARAGLTAGLGPAQLAKSIGAPPFIVDKLKRQARRFTAEHLDRSLCALADADFALKGGRPLSRTLGRDLGDRAILDRLIRALLPAADRR